MKKTQAHQKKGEYKETKTDTIKKTSNRLVEICGAIRTIITSDGEKIRFKNKKAFTVWAKNNSYVPDF